jgi:phosphotransferase system HPr-like phosphotransfer protein
MGSKIMVEADGPDEAQAMEAVTGLIAARFEESE